MPRSITGLRRGSSRAERGHQNTAKQGASGVSAPRKDTLGPG